MSYHQKEWHREVDYFPTIKLKEVLINYEDFKLKVLDNYFIGILYPLDEEYMKLLWQRIFQAYYNYNLRFSEVGNFYIEFGNALSDNYTKYYQIYKTMKEIVKKDVIEILDNIVENTSDATNEASNEITSTDRTTSSNTPTSVTIDEIEQFINDHSKNVGMQNNTITGKTNAINSVKSRKMYDEIEKVVNNRITDTFKEFIQEINYLFGKEY